MSLWMNTGTIAVNLNNKKVTGTGTAFVNSAIPARPGQPIVISNVIYEIESVESDTVLWLSTNYLGASAADVKYSVMTTMEGSFNDLARRAAQVMGAYQGYMDVYQQLFTGTGTVHVVLPDGTEYDLPAWGNSSKWDTKYQMGYMDLVSQNLHSLTVFGEYAQADNASATLERNYPVANKAGVLVYRRSINGGMFIYTTVDGVQYSKNKSPDGSWPATWVKQFGEASPPKIEQITSGTFSGKMTAVPGLSSLKLPEGASLEIQGSGGSRYHLLSKAGKLGAYSTSDASLTLFEIDDSSFTTPNYILAKTAIVISNPSSTTSISLECQQSGEPYIAAKSVGQTVATLVVQVGINVDFKRTVSGPSFTPTSDSRLKPQELRSNLSNVSAALRQFTPKYYFKQLSLDDTEQGFYEFGFIADEIEVIEPRLVSTMDDEHQLKCLSDKGIVAHLVAGWQEHDDRLDKVEKLLESIDLRLKAAGI